MRVKIDPSNLSVIHVFEPKERFWIRVEAINKHYTQGLSLHRHELNLKWANERYGRETSTPCNRRNGICSNSSRMPFRWP